MTIKTDEEDRHAAAERVRKAEQDLKKAIEAAARIGIEVELEITGDRYSLEHVPVPLFSINQRVRV